MQGRSESYMWEHIVVRLIAGCSNSYYIFILRQSEKVGRQLNGESERKVGESEASPTFLLLYKFFFIIHLPLEFLPVSGPTER